MKKRDRRGGGRQCLTPTVQNPGAVKLARALAGMEQQQLAARIGISKGYMSEIESGRRGVEAPRLLEIARALGCKAKALVNPAYAEALGCDIDDIAAQIEDSGTTADGEPEEAVPEAA